MQHILESFAEILLVCRQDLGECYGLVSGHVVRYAFSLHAELSISAPSKRLALLGALVDCCLTAEDEAPALALLDAVAPQLTSWDLGELPDLIEERTRQASRARGARRALLYTRLLQAGWDLGDPS